MEWRLRDFLQWTVDMYLMFDMGHPDVLPLTDLGIVWRANVGNVRLINDLLQVYARDWLLTLA